MSAFVPSKLHYDLLVKTIIEGPADPLDPQDSLSFRWSPKASSYDELGETLLRETVRSVWHRYEDEDMIPDWARQRYTYKDPGFALSPVEFIKALQCYRYQSCEHPGWEGSEADRLTKEALLGVSLDLVTVLLEEEYDSAPWEWTEKEAQERIER